MNKDAVYHACRVSFVAAEEGVPWHMVLHALREGLELRDYMTHKLTEEELNRHPQLRELMERLRQTL